MLTNNKVSKLTLSSVLLRLMVKIWYYKASILRQTAVKHPNIQGLKDPLSPVNFSSVSKILCFSIAVKDTSKECFLYTSAILYI